MALADDEQVVQAIRAHGADPALRVGVRRGRPVRRADDLDPPGGEHRVEGHCQANGAGRGRWLCDTLRMKNETCSPSYKRHRFPRDIIAHAVWLYFRFALSYRDVEELLAERGVLVTD